MPVPEFYRFFRPVLQALAEKNERSLSQIESSAVEIMKLGAAELEELLPSGRRTKVNDRVRWAVTYLFKAKCLDRVKPGIYKITKRGEGFLTTAQETIKPSHLNIFPEFVEFYKWEPGTSEKVAPISLESTPEEEIDQAFSRIKEQLVEEILTRVKESSPAYFEWLIVELMLRLGYGAAIGGSGTTLGRSGDGGIDGVIKEDRLGLENIYLQAKRFTNESVGRPLLQAFVGALTGHSATKGVFITTSKFTQEAQQYARTLPNIKLSLIDGYQLAHLMVEVNLGVSITKTFELKQVDSDFFEASGDRS